MRGVVLALVALLLGMPGYERTAWRHWTDVDGDCQNTRAEVLIRDSLTPVTFATERECRVVAGYWWDPYTGRHFRRANQVDVDHVVPLANAHASGGWAWSAEARERYANSTPGLLTVSARANRQKGAKGPDEWMPPRGEYACEYAGIWLEIKRNWRLTLTVEEAEAVFEALEQCDPNGSGQ